MNREIQDEDYKHSENLKEDCSQNRTKLPKTAEACDRYLVSDRAGAAIVSGVLRDYGIISEDKSSQAIGLRKLANERHSYRMARRDQEKTERDVITSLYFDGEKTATRVMKQNTKTGGEGSLCYESGARVSIPVSCHISVRPWEDYCCYHLQIPEGGELA